MSYIVGHRQNIRNVSAVSMPYMWAGHVGGRDEIAVHFLTGHLDGIGYSERYMMYNLDQHFCGIPGMLTTLKIREQNRPSSDDEALEVEIYFRCIEK